MRYNDLLERTAKGIYKAERNGRWSWKPWRRLDPEDQGTYRFAAEAALSEIEDERRRPEYPSEIRDLYGHEMYTHEASS